MDSYNIIEQKGYRREDLTKEHQAIMETLDWFQEHCLENIKDNMDMVDDDFFGNEKPEGIIEQAKWEYALKVIDKVIEYFDMNKAEFQVTLAEEEPDKGE